MEPITVARPHRILTGFCAQSNAREHDTRNRRTVKFVPGVAVRAIGRALALNDSFDFLGYVIIGIFVLSWIGSVVFYRLKGYDDLEVNTAREG
jgi:hypothetical protein